MAYEKDFPMTLQEIADELGTNTKVIAYTIHRALQKIKARPESLAALRELVQARNMLRDRGGDL